MRGFDHELTGPLGRRGMLAMFAIAVTEPMSDHDRALAYGHWCGRLQRRAAVAHIVWLPAAGDAMTFADIPTQRIEQILLGILAEIPVFPGGVCTRPTVTPKRSRLPKPRL
jgi:hypothetical protein